MHTIEKRGKINLIGKKRSRTVQLAVVFDEDTFSRFICVRFIHVLVIYAPERQRDVLHADMWATSLPCDILLDIFRRRLSENIFLFQRWKWFGIFLSLLFSAVPIAFPIKSGSSIQPYFIPMYLSSPLAIWACSRFVIFDHCLVPLFFHYKHHDLSGETKISIRNLLLAPLWLEKTNLIVLEI